MSYQVLARKWRPQRFDDVVGQEAVTRTLRNAITSGRVAQAFVFAGSRGCGKTTTARIVARALNCQNGPTAEPCGACDACIEIAQGRDIDVLEIDAASHTGIDNIREVVIAGLSIAPVRNRYKVFIIDEVHQLSPQSFNALLKSVEEPPAHVVFIMATTELHKIPDTILSRSQVFEFRSIPTKAIAAQIERIAVAEQIEVSAPAIALIARAAEGSMRDAQSAFDQVISFAGRTISVEDVSTVLGLVGRDILFDIIDAVVDEDGAKAFALADRAVESGHDLKLVCRELSSLMRDIMLLSIDPERAGETALAEGEHARLTQLATRFSREDLMRAFDLLAKAEQDIRNAAHPRYHFEMALLRWMHLRKLVPLVDLLEGQGAGGGISRPSLAPAARPVSAPAARTPSASRPPAMAASRQPAPAPINQSQGPKTSGAAGPRSAPAHAAPVSTDSDHVAPAGSGANLTGSGLKDALLADIRSRKSFFYNTVVAQAQKIEVGADTVTFTFLPAHRALREQFDRSREWLEPAVERLAGRRMAVAAVQAESGAAPEAVAPVVDTAPAADAGGGRDLKAEAMSSSVVQAMLDVFPAEIRTVEDIK